MRTKNITFIFLIIGFLIGINLQAQEKFEIEAGTDIVSRYNWRGIDFGNSPAFQPSLSANYFGFQLGVWGSYTFNETASVSDEIDSWLSYSFNINSVSISAILTDYYFPNSGLRFGNFNNFDDTDGAGAHTLEFGLSIGSASFPLSLSAYYNFYNDAGNNAYFQLDYNFNVNNYGLNLFCGATPGSKDNPAYYGSDKFNVINVGVKATKSIKITDNFDLPVFVVYGMNPRVDQAFMVLGITL
jgi:hypothetical protein